MNEDFIQEKFIQEKFTSGCWSEKVLVVTNDFEITGYVFMPKTGKKNRILSDILNGKRHFVAIKECDLRKHSDVTGQVEHYEFIQVNLDSIIILRPYHN